MSVNPYLKRLREQHEALHQSISGVQTRAAEGSRDLSEEELRSVKEQAAQLKTISEQIESLSEIETRAAKVNDLAAKLGDTKDDNADGEQGGQQNRSAAGEQGEHQNRDQGDQGERLGKTHTRDRDPGHYRRASEGGQHSFFGDHYRAATQHNQDAKKRLAEHMRAVTVASGGDGIVPPRWLMDEYEAIGRQNRVVADAVRHLPLGMDPRPMVLPKQTTGTDANLLVQAAEGANTAGWGTDRFETDTDTLTPSTYAAYQDVSRQLLNSSDPGVDSLIFGDLRAAWDAKVESLTCAAILAGGTATGTTFADEGAFALNAVAIDAVVDAQTAVAGDLRGPADLAVMNFRRFGAYRKLKDSTNRPLMPVSRYGPQNATGQLGNLLVGDIEGIDALASSGVPTTYAEKFAVLRRNAVILAESDLLDFTYEQVVGPAAVRVGIFGYVGTLVRNPKSVAILTVTVADDGV